VLGGLAGTVVGGALAGCWPGSNKPATPPPPHPLTSAVAGTQALVDRYRTTIGGYPDLGARLEPLLANHRAHLDALRNAMGLPSPSASPSAATASPSASVAADQAGALAALRTVEQAARTEAATACLAARAEYAPLLGSIAACRATHAEVLGS
jgi:hypothetical protein